MVVLQAKGTVPLLMYTRQACPLGVPYVGDEQNVSFGSSLRGGRTRHARFGEIRLYHTSVRVRLRYT